jgi:CRISPR-associated protein Cmr2
MSHHLLELSFGPVQGFIVAARRSRDLWAGSRLLSESVRAAACTLRSQGATLIYPTPEAVENKAGSNLSNVLLARVDSADAQPVAALAAAAMQAARDRLAELADKERIEWKKAAPGLREGLWSQQITGVLEAYAAWSSWDGRDETYKACYDALKRAFAQRKNTRDFAPAPRLSANDAGLPKSSLDGANESVLPRERRRSLIRMGVGEGEQLDAIGCVKRSFGRQESFTALTRIAADAWLAGLPDEKLTPLAATYEPLVGLGLATRCSGNDGTYDRFPYDAGLLFGGALDAALATARREGEAQELTALEALRRAMQAIKTRPNPYVALMSADGDRMGVFVDQARNPRDHAAISEAITRFADRVPAIAREHRGHAIFNGGEDLMVAFPLQHVVQGARALAMAFDAAVKPVVDRLLDPRTQAEQGRPTLRAGVAICHVGEPMGFIREAAERAEKFAKGDTGGPRQGNALGLVLNSRGGHEVKVRMSFDPAEAESFAALERWIEAYAQDQLSSRVAYDIREIDTLRRRLAPQKTDPQGKPSSESYEHLDTILETEFHRVLQRARKSGGGSGIEEMQEPLKKRQAQLGDWAALGNELVLARWLSAATEAELGERMGD